MDNNCSIACRDTIASLRLAHSRNPGQRERSLFVDSIASVLFFSHIKQNVFFGSSILFVQNNSLTALHSSKKSGIDSSILSLRPTGW